MRLRFLAFLSLLALAVHTATAQVADTTKREPGATVSGVVRDSIGHGPLRGAAVQLVAADAQTRFARTVMSDSTGWFEIGDVPDGTYTLGFFHPLLDSLGVEPLLRSVSIKRHKSVRADLATPSPARLRAAICGGKASSDSAAIGGLLMGTVRDAHDRTPAADVKVTGEWLELTFFLKGIDRRRPRFVVTTGQNGWFAMCNVPSGGTMFLGAARGADTTDLVEVVLPPSGFLRRDIYLGISRTVVRADSTPLGEKPGADSVARAPRAMHFGDMRLRGTVTTVDGRRPLAGAEVRIVDGPQTRTNERGEWTLVDAPAGSRMLEVRAIGFYPAHRGVDVITDAPPVRVTLSTFKAMLDTVRIIASRISDKSQGGFDFRRRSTGGHFITEEQLARRVELWTSDIFRMTSGVRVEGAGLDRWVLVRSAFGGYCRPAVFIDGLYMFNLSADEIDGMVSPKRLRGIEIYADPWTPAEFQVAMSGCGAIVFWTK